MDEYDDCCPWLRRPRGYWRMVTADRPFDPKEAELTTKKNNLIKEFEKFLNKTNSDVPGRDELRDKIRDFKEEEKKHMLKEVTC